MQHFKIRHNYSILIIPSRLFHPMGGVLLETPQGQKTRKQENDYINVIHIQASLYIIFVLFVKYWVIWGILKLLQ